MAPAAHTAPARHEGGWHWNNAMKIKSNSRENVVCSFTLAVAGSGAVEGACIKYAMLDGASRLAYMAADGFFALKECIELYSALNYIGSDLQRMEEESGFRGTLSKRHPVRTMHDAKPRLTDDEFHAARRDHLVASLRLVDEGAACRIECVYQGLHRRQEVLPAYIAMHLCTAMQRGVEMCRLLGAKPAGSA